MDFNQIRPRDDRVVAGKSKTCSPRRPRTEVRPFPYGGILSISSHQPSAWEINATSLSASRVESCHPDTPVESHTHLARAFHQNSVKLSAAYSISRPFGDSRAG